MKELVDFLARSLVSNQSAVEVEQSGDENNLKLRLYVAKEDIGKVIGKRGRTAKSIRVLLNSFARSQKKTVSLEIVEPKETAKDNSEPCQIDNAQA